MVAKTSKSHSPPHIGASPGSQEAWDPTPGQSDLCLRTSQKKTQEAPHQDDSKDSSEQLQDMGAPHLSERAGLDDATFLLLKFSIFLSCRWRTPPLFSVRLIYREQIQMILNNVKMKNL